MGLPAIKTEEHFTYADYCSWPGDEHSELIEGVAYNMCAAPNRNHQGIGMELARQVAGYLKGETLQGLC